MEKIPRFDSRNALSWVRSENSTPAILRRLRLDLFTVRGWCVLGAGIFLVFLAFMFGRHELMALGISLVVLAGISWALALGLRGRTRIQRQLLSAVPSAGEVCKVQLHCLEPATIQEQLPEGFGRGPMLDTPGELEYELIFGRRGIHQLGPAQQIVSDTLGLVRGMVNTGDTLEVPVRSELMDLHRLASLGEQMLTGDARHSRSTTADYYDVAIRDYQQGDSIRQVHWKSSARQGKLMVRQENHVATAQALLILDTKFEHWCHSGVDLRLSIPGGSNEDLPSSRRFETALSLASGIGLRYSTGGYQLSFRDLSGAPLTSQHRQATSDAAADSDFDSFHAATAELALDASGPDTDASELFGDGLHKELLGFRDEPVIMIFGELTVAQARWLATLARTVRLAEVFILVAHPERYDSVQQELAGTGWKVHLLPGTMGAAGMWGG